MFKTITEENGEVSLIYYIPNVLTQTEQNDIKVWLDNNPNFLGGTSSFGTEIPREQIWYQEAGHYFSKDWVVKYPRWEAHSYDQFIINLQNNNIHHRAL